MTQVRAAKAPEPSPQSPRPIRVACRSRPDGRVAVVVKVLPVSDADVERGVFVDLVQAATDPGVRRAEKLAALARAPSPARGKGKRAITSFRIAPAQHLVTGESETFRSELTLPSASIDGSSWFLRGRFATSSGDELRSMWVRLS